jgi:hypothetical protein
LHKDDFKQRIVEIGWAIGGVLPDSTAEPESFIIKPEGFSISQQAVAHHGITTDMAIAGGVDLRCALETFLNKVREVVRQGGCIVAHNLEFDTGIIANELCNAGLEDMLQEWTDIAKNGVCTMDEDIMSWAISCAAGDNERPTTPYPLQFLGLEKAVKLLVPRSPLVSELLSKKGSAKADAQMHRLLYNSYRAAASEIAD